MFGKGKVTSFACETRVTRPTIIEETKLIVRRDATKAGTSACKTFEFKSRCGKNFREGPARSEDPQESNEIVSLTEGESSACDEDATRERRRMFVKNPCKRSSRNRNEKERRLKIPRNSAKVEYYDQHELLSKRKISPRKGSSTCDENNDNNSSRDRVSFARINSPSKGSLRRRISFVLARTGNGDEDEREGMKIQARRRNPGEGDGREKISVLRIENEASSSMITEARMERLASRDEMLRERGESNGEIKGERWSTSSGSEWMDAGDARRYAKSYRCEWCEETFYRATNLSSHVNRTCPRNPDTIRRRSNAKNFNDTLYVCDTCGRRFKHKKNLTFHARNECGKVSTCKFCKKDFKAAKVPYRHREACKRRCEQTNATVMFRSRSSRNHDANDSIVSDSSTSNFMFEIISDSE